jgi:DNA (cytosine-5)-methyltransferase 1
MKPRLLDLFCGAGGAAMGYHRAGFEVIGVDIKSQPNYPFPFIQADALRPPVRLEDFDAIHASPPCQRYSSITRVSGIVASHPDLVAPTRGMLRGAGRPYVIENVERAPLVGPVKLCAVAMGRAIDENGIRFVIRQHRLFECSFSLLVPPCACSRDAGTVLGVYGGGTRQDTRLRKNLAGGNTQKANRRQARLLIDMPWATRAEMNQAIPPAYTEFIGEQLMAYLKVAA